MSREIRRAAPLDYRLRRENPFLRWSDIPHSVAPYVPTPIKVVRNMLKLAKVGVKDVVYDLGCGDGRILFTAVNEFQAHKAVGIDINPSVCDPVKDKIETLGLGDRITVMNDNFFLVDITSATVITLYLTTSGNSKLRPKLEEELKPGTRVVSHDFPIHNWKTSKINPPEYYTIGSHKVYVYEVPGAYKKKKIHRKPNEESRWKRIKNLFLNEKF